MLVRWFVRVCAFVPRTPPKLHRFRERRHLCRPWFAPPSTSACAQSRFEFVEIGRGMCSNYPRRHWDYKHVRGWYHRVSRTIYETTVYMYEYMYGMYRYQRCTCRIRMNILMRTYLCDVRMAYLGGYTSTRGMYTSIFFVFVVVLVFTLKSFFLPNISIPPVSFLILHPRETLLY